MSIRIGNAQGFWGDSSDAPARLFSQCSELDYLTLDYLAEVSLSIMALQRDRDPRAGYARDFVQVVRSLVPFWKQGQRTKVVCNAGGLNPVGCAEACVAVLREAGLFRMKVGIVSGDDVLTRLREDPANAHFQDLENRRPLAQVVDRLVTANAYIGADGVARALAEGADIVVTGRVADPSLTVGICVHEWGWGLNDFHRLAAATVAGHIIECGVQCCGGIATNWLDLPNPADMGFPIVEMEESGEFVVTKPEGTGGRVNLETTKEQLVYEIGNPAHYLSPDCRVDFTTLHLEEAGRDRVRVRNARGARPTHTYKVSATYRDGYWAQGLLTIFGRDAVTKARRCGDVILERLRRAGFDFARTNIECLGANACAAGALAPPPLLETVLRISVADPRKEAVERFASEIAPLVTSGPQGVTGYAAGRPDPRPVFRYWPCLIAREDVTVETRVFDV